MTGATEVAGEWTRLAMDTLHLGDEMIAGNELSESERESIEQLQKQTRQSIARLAVSVAELENTE